MTKLIEKLNARQHEDRAAARREYAAILRSNSSSKATLERLQQIMQTLGLDQDQISADAALLAEHENLKNKAGRLSELRAARTQAAEAYAEQRHLTEEQIKAAENALKQAERKRSAIDRELHEATTADHRVKTLEAQYAWLLMPEAITVSISAEYLPPSVDPRALKIPQSGEFTEEELEQKFGIPDAKKWLGYANLHPMRDGRFFGGAVLAWAREARAKILHNQRKKLAAKLICGVDLDQLTTLNNLRHGQISMNRLSAYYGVQLQHFQILFIHSYGSHDSFDADEVAHWARYAKTHNQKIMEEIANIDLELLELDPTHEANTFAESWDPTAEDPIAVAEVPAETEGSAENDPLRT